MGMGDMAGKKIIIIFYFLDVDKGDSKGDGSKKRGPCQFTRIWVKQSLGMSKEMSGFSPTELPPTREEGFLLVVRGV